MDIFVIERNRFYAMKLTLGTTYYNCPELLINFIDHHREYFDEVIVVDDGSTVPAENYIKDRDKIKLYRVPIDYGFNSHGCRNLIMKQTTNDWTVLFDVDRMFIDPKSAVEIIRKRKLKEQVLYLFEMFADYNNPKTIHSSVNDFLVHKNHFWSAGGYDEELIGMRNGDRQYRQQLLNFGQEKLLHGIQAKFTRKPSLHINTFSANDKITDDTILKTIVENRIINPKPNKKTLTFKWHRVF
jgi:glycosyltransferase involved in cell wall biosynthesis